MFTKFALVAACLAFTPELRAQDKPAAPAEKKKEEPAKAQSAAPVSDAAIDAIKKFIDEKKVDTKSAGWKTKLPKPPQLTFDPKHTYTWVMETNKGTIKIKLLPDVAPMHVSSCIYLNTLGFYDGLKFHRVLQGFMAQGGDPLGTGSGSPGYQMRIEIKPEMKHDKPGMLSTARTNDPNTDGSQFFLTFGPTPFLDGQYTIYGEAVDGLDVVKKLEAAGRDRSWDERTKGTATPTEELLIKKGTIEVK